MKEKAFNGIWGLGVRALHFGKRIGVTGPLENILSGFANRLIPLPSHETHVSLAFGMSMVVPPGFPRARTYSTGLYELEVTSTIEGILKKGMTFIDVGAFCGYYTLFASYLVGVSGKVYAFEPHPKNFAYLLGNIEASDCPNVFSVNAAIHDTTGLTELTSHPEADHHWISTTAKNDSSVMVPTVSMDDFFADKNWPPIDLVKMDIEGGETAALHGMRELSRRNLRMQLIMEFDLGNAHRSGATREDLFGIVQEPGFHDGFVIKQNLRPFDVVNNAPRTRGTYNLLLKKDK